MANDKKFIVKNGLLTPQNAVIGSTTDTGEKLQVTGSSKLVGEVNITFNDVSGIPLTVENSAGSLFTPTLGKFIGDSSSLDIVNFSGGDYKLVNSATDSGIVFYNNTAGIRLTYAGSPRLAINSSGNRFYGLSTTTIDNNRILTTADEGSGNGLDADTVDGLEGSQFVRSDVSDTMAGSYNILNDLTIQGDLTVSGNTTTVNTEEILLADNTITLNSNYTGSNPTENAGIEVERGTLNNPKIIWNETQDYWQLEVNNLVVGRIITTADEGSGNGFDADTVDGLEASQFLRSDTDDTATGNITIEGDLTIGDDSGGAQIFFDGAGVNRVLYSQNGDIGFLNASFNYALKSDTSGDLEVERDVEAGRDVTADRNIVADDNITATTGDITASAGDITATAGNITATAGNVSATAGNVTAGDSITAQNDITATTGDIEASAGSVTAQTNVTATTGNVTAGDSITAQNDITATTGDISASAGSVSAATTVTAGTDVIGQRFVDADNNGYVTDPSGTSTMHEIGIDDNLFHNGDTDTRLQFTTDDISLQTGGAERLGVDNAGVDITGDLDVTGAISGASGSFSGTVTATQFIDADDNTYLVDPASTSRVNTIDLAGTIRHDGDTNTYLAFPAADTFRIFTGGTQRVNIDNDSADFAQNVYAPRYYDSDNDVYYGDFASTSQMNRIDIDDYIRHRGDTDTYFGFAAGDTFRIFTGGSQKVNIDSNSADFTQSIYAPTYYDSDNSSYFADFSSGSLSINANGEIRTDYAVQVTAIDGAGNITPGSNAARLSGYGLIGNRGTVYITNAGGSVQIGNGTTHNANPGLTITTSRVESARDVYAPRYFDSNNPAFVGDFASTSVMNDIELVGQIIHEGDPDTHITFGAADQFDVVTGGHGILTANTTVVFIDGDLTVNGTVTATSGEFDNLYASVYYDKDDNNFYGDFASTSRVNDISLVGEIIHDGDTDTYLNFNAADSFEIVTGGTQRVLVDTSLVTTSLQIFAPDVFATKFYSSSNALFYTDPVGTSVMNTIDLDGQIRHNGDTDTYIEFHAANQFRVVTGGSERLEVSTFTKAQGSVKSPIFYDLDNEVYYGNFAGTSQMNRIDINDYIRHRGDTNTFFGFDGNDQITFRTGGTERLNIDNDSADFAVDVYAPKFIDSNNNNYYIDPYNASLAATFRGGIRINEIGNYTRYSDNSGNGGIALAGYEDIAGGQSTTVAISGNYSGGYSLMYLNRIDPSTNPFNNGNRYIEFRADGADGASFRGDSSGNLYLTPQTGAHIGFWTSGGNEVAVALDDGNFIVGGSSVSYTSSDNTPLVGSITNNKLHVNGSIQLAGNNDAIVFGRGTSTFLKDEELGFGWGGGFYMTEGTTVKVRNNKDLESTGQLRFASAVFTGDVNADEIYARRFVDTNDGTFLLDPNNNSTLNTLRLYQKAAPINDWVALNIDNGNGTGDIDEPESWIAYSFTDSNANFTPQVRIGARAGYNTGSADNLDKEGSGNFIVQTSQGTGGAGAGSIRDTFWVDYLGNSHSLTSSRAPIFYDSNNTAYYFDGNGRTIMYQASVANQLAVGATSGYVTNAVLDVAGPAVMRSTNTLYFGVTTTNYNSWQSRIYNRTSATLAFDAQDFEWGNVGYSSGAARMFFDASAGRLDVTGQIRTPIYYDRDNAAFYGNFAGTSVMNNIHLGSTANLTDGTDPDLSTTLIYATSKVVTPRLVFLNDASGDDNYIVHSDNNNAHAVAGQAMGAWYEFVGDKIAATSSNSSGIVASGILSHYGQFNNQVRAPIFYDTNTNYYGDFASTSQMSQIDIDSYIRHRGDTNTYFGFPANDQIVFYTDATQRFFIDTDSADFSVNVYAPRYYDSDDGSFYADPAGTSLQRRMNLYSGESTGEFNVGRGSTQRFNMYVTDGVGYIRYYQDESNGTDHSVEFQIQSPSSGANEFRFNRQVKLTGSGGEGYIFARRFVDQDNSSYFVDPASNSFMASITLQQNTVGQAYANVADQPTYYIGGQRGDNDAWKIYGESPSGTNTGNLILQSEDDYDTNETIRMRFKKTYSPYDTRDNLVAYFNRVESPTSFRAPIFYDLDNANYYVDPAGNSRMSQILANRIYPCYDNSTAIYIDYPTGNYGSIQVNGGGKGGWEGYSINGRYVLMSADNDQVGLYNDVDNEWMLYASRNAGLDLYYNGNKQAETENGYFLATNQMRAPIYYDSDNANYYGNFAAGNTNRALRINGRIYRDGFAGGDGDNNKLLETQDYTHWIWNTATNWGIFWAGNNGARYSHFSTSNPNEIVFVGAGNVRASIDLDNGDGYFQGELAAGNFALNGGNENISLNPAYGSGLADDTLFDGTEYWERRVIRTMQGAENSSTTTTSEFVKNPDSPSASSYVIRTSAYRTFYSDYINVEPGERLYGEIAARYISGSGGVLYYGIERFDKDKRPIAGNTGTTYFVASNVNITSTGWTVYSGHTVLPTTHTPYNGSDGGGVRYVRIRILMNYNAGGALREFAAPILKRAPLQSDIIVQDVTADDVIAQRFIDRDNTNYFIDPSNNGQAARLRGRINIDGDNNDIWMDMKSASNGYGRIRMGAYAGDPFIEFSDRSNNSGSDQVWAFGADDRETGSMVIRWNGSGSFPADWTSSGSEFFQLKANGNLSLSGGEPNSYRLHVGGTAYASSSMRSPIYYDHDNDGFFGNFAGRSNLNELDVRARARFFGRTTDTGGSWSYAPSGSRLREYLSNTSAEFHSGNDEPVTIYFRSGVNAPSDFGYITFDPDYDNSGEEAAIVIGVENDSNDYIRLQSTTIVDSDHISSESTMMMEWRYRNSQRAYLNTDRFYHNTEIQAPIFRDTSSPTTWYVDPSGTSNVNVITANQFNMRDRGDFITFYGNDNNYHSISSRDNGGGISDDLRFNSYHDIFFNLDSNNNNSTGSTGFYVGQHGAGTGSISGWPFRAMMDGNVYASTAFRAPEFIDLNDPNYYVNPNSTSRMYQQRLIYRLHIGDESNLYNGVLQETRRPDLTIKGQYPQLNLMSSEISNGTHGPTLRFVAYDSSNASSGNFKHWVMGIAATNATRFSIGYSQNQTNPHYGIGRGWSSGNNVAIFWIQNDRHVYAENDVQAGRFVDRNASSYFAHPGDRSDFYDLRLRSNYVRTYAHSGSDFTAGTLVRTSIPATATNGASFVLEATGKSYSGDPPFSFTAQGYLYNNTIISYSGQHFGKPGFTTMYVFQYQGVLHFWWPRVSYWNSFAVHVRNANGDDRNLVEAITNSGLPSGRTKERQITMKVTAVYNQNINTGDMYARRYYDTDNPAYWADPAGQSRFNTLTLQGNRLGFITNNFDAEIRVDDSNDFGTGAAFRLYGDGVVDNAQLRTEVLVATTRSYGEIFYEWNDTNWYVDPNGTSRINRLHINPRNDNYNVGSINNTNSQSNWQSLTNVNGQFTVTQYNNLNAYAEAPRNVYTYGSVLSTRTANHSFQLYSAHTGDLAYKTQWNNDNYSGWLTPVVYGRNSNSASGHAIYADIYYDRDTNYFFNGNADLSIRVYGEISNSNYVSGNMQPGALNIGRTDRNYRWDGSSWAGNVLPGIMANFNEYWEFILHDSGDAVKSFMYYDGTDDMYFGRNIGWGTMRARFEADIYAPRMFDSNGGGYVIDPGGISEMHEIRLDDLMRHRNDTNSYIYWPGGDDFQIVAGGRQVLRMSEGGDPDRLRFVTDSNWTDSNGDWNMSRNVTVGGTLYAPIFRDSNDPNNYYVDPNGSSRLNNLDVNILTADRINNQNQWYGDIVLNGNENTYYPVTWYGGNQDEIVEIEIYRGYSEQAPWNPIGTGVHHGGLSMKLRANFGGWGGSTYDFQFEDFRETYTTIVAEITRFANNRALCIWLRGGGSGGAIYHVRIKGRNVGPTVSYGSYDPGGNGTGVSPRTDTPQTNIQNHNHTIGADLQARNSYSYTYYDRNSTGYYLDAYAGTVALRTYGGWLANTSNWSGNPGSNVGKLQYHSNRWYINAGSNSNMIAQFRRGGSDVARIDNDGDLAITNGDPTIRFVDTNHRSAHIHVNSNIFYVLRGSGTNSTGWSTTNGRWPLEIHLNDNNAYFGGHVWITGNARSFRSNSTSSWSGDPGSSTGKIEYHSNRWYYNAGPNSTEVARFRRGGGDVAVMNNNGWMRFGSSSGPSYSVHGSDIYANGGWLRVSGSQGVYWESHDTRIYSPNSTYIYTRSNNGWIFANRSAQNKGYVYHDTNNFGLLNAGGSWRIRIDNRSNNDIEFYGSNQYGTNARFSIYYDRDSGSSYYGNFGGTSRMNQISVDRINFLGGAPAYFYTSSGNLRGYIRATETNDSHFEFATSGNEDIIFRDGGFGGSWNQIIRGNGQVLTENIHDAQIFRDRNDTNYYVNPSTTSRLFNLRVEGGHGDTRLQLHYNHPSNIYDSHLTLWASEPGITYDNCGIGGNINFSGQYYGRQINDNPFGTYVRFDVNNGYVEAWTTSGTAGASGGQGTRQWYVNTGGDAIARGAYSAPLFRSSSNSSYRFQPGVSSAWRLQTPTGYLDIGSMNSSYVHFQSDRGRFYFSRTCYFDQDIRAYGTNESAVFDRFIDRNDGNYWVQPRSTSYLAYLGRRGHNTGHLVGSYNSVGENSRMSNPIYTIGSSYNPSTTTLSNMYGIGYTYAANASFINLTAANGWGMYVAADGDARIFFDGTDGSGSFSGTCFATEFVDINSSTYRVNPAGQSNMNTITLRGNRLGFITTSFDAEIRVDDSNPYGAGALFRLYGDTAADNAALRTEVLIATTRSYGEIFYEWDDTGRYVDPSGFSRLNTLRLEGNSLEVRGSSPTIYFRDTNNRSAMIHNNSNLLYILRGSGNDSTSWQQVNGYWPVYWNLENNDATFGGSIFARTNITAYSDARLKENVETIENALDKVMQLRGVNYNWIDDPNNTRKIGVIAQEVQEVLPEVVQLHQDEEDKEGTLSVDYGNMTALLIEAMKEQQELINNQNNIINNQQTQIDELKALVEQLINK